MDKCFQIKIYSHFFKVLYPTPRAIPCIMRFCGKYTLYQWVRNRHGKGAYQATKVFAVRTRDSKEFRFHIGQLKDFMDAVERDYITPEMYSVEYQDMHIPTSIVVAMREGWLLRDYQERAHNFSIEDTGDDNRSRLIAMPTGTGKGVTSLSIIAKLQTRTLVVVLPTYLEKWAVEINQILTIENKEIMIIQGSKQLKGLIDMGLEGTIESKFILVSLRTIQNFYKTYELNPASLEEEGYGCHPEDLCKVLGIGTVILDETHQHLHAIYKFLTYTNVPKVIALSATLLSDDPVVAKVQHMMFPKEIRFDEIKMEKYIKCYSVSYNFDDIKRSGIRITEYGSNKYSHTAFEKSILRNHRVLKGYIGLIDYLIGIGYMENYQPGDKLIIFVATIALCEQVTQYLKQRYPHLDVRRYVEQDPFENVIEADIRVTTVLSAGTAIDIPQLTTSIQTVNLKSSQSNLQSMGRLRKLKDRDVRFYYVYCNQIDKHHEFHKHRMELFHDRVECLKEFKYPFSI